MAGSRTAVYLSRFHSQILAFTARASSPGSLVASGQRAAELLQLSEPDDHPADDLRSSPPIQIQQMQFPHTASGMIPHRLGGAQPTNPEMI